jgi:hypothetical protein
MKTSELAVGTHVAYNRGSRSYPSFVEAYVITHRPKGNRSSYWGPNGNTETVGIAYKNRYSKVPQWDTEWVRPAQLEMLWSEYAETQARIQKRQDEREAANKKRIRNNKKLMAGLPAEVKALFSDYQLEAAQDRGATVTLTVDLLVKLVDAAQKAHPKVKAATVEEEVAAALALLG